MAIEDAYQLGKDLFEEADRSRSAAKVLDPEPVLKVGPPEGWALLGQLSCALLLLGVLLKALAAILPNSAGVQRTVLFSAAAQRAVQSPSCLCAKQCWRQVLCLHALSLASMQGWVRKRLLRVSAVHGLAGMAAIMASTYKAYLGEGLGPLSWIQKFKIPHPGRVSPCNELFTFHGLHSAFQHAARYPALCQLAMCLRGRLHICLQAGHAAHLTCELPVQSVSAGLLSVNLLAGGGLCGYEPDHADHAWLGAGRQHSEPEHK